ncbi:ubiquitin carboxyl-terminal hydrolase 4 isoform X1 [Scyliorhinus canicula]|uniref:ubiquitin carboxyl-terminal hydrolase 4 isoform X1 n=1 Tax=Scyliorhinus canicula TaxID=7830 RepID=UPI0018F77204|nr:ubiquitin carboxyl-terminal hydrolase 4 isoform X1 [Scyliorhinus canicula]
MAEGGVPDLESQKNEIGNLLKTALKKGDSWFLIDSRWFKQWKKYVGFDSWDTYNVGERGMFPGPIDNSGLFTAVESQALKEHLIDELDYVLVPTEAWNKLVNWYACVVGQEPIVRKVVEHGMFVKHCKVEVYLLELKLCENNNMENVVTRHFSKADTIDTIEKEMRKLFNISVGKETRLWNRYMTNTYEQLNKPDSTVQDAGLYQGQVLVIEQKNDDGTWPRQTSQANKGRKTHERNMPANNNKSGGQRDVRSNSEGKVRELRTHRQKTPRGRKEVQVNQEGEKLACRPAEQEQGVATIPLPAQGQEWRIVLKSELNGIKEAIRMELHKEMKEVLSETTDQMLRTIEGLGRKVEVQEKTIMELETATSDQSDRIVALETEVRRSSTATSRNLSTSPKSSTSCNSYLSSPSTVSNGESNNSSNSSYILNSSSSTRGMSGYGSSYNSSYNYRESHSPSQAGLCGLSNLGNTCFMNSALQCLSNTGPLTDYFLQGKYEEELNRENPLGMRGEIAEAYADLIKQMWSGRSSYVAPRIFKTQVGCFAPQFSGYQQQDSQELLAFLLDGLHEDLNRVKKKPYLELKDANGREDEVVAKEAWENHRLRNNSIIVDIFHGLFKSTLVCPECSKISVTFDPFCYLTLPLPMKKDRTMEIFLVRADSSRPTQYRIVVPKMGAISDLCTALFQISGVAAEKMVVADVYNHRFHKTYRQDEALNHIMDRDDIFVYEVPSVREEDSDSSKWINLPVYFREKRMRSSNTPAGTILFGQPLLVSIPRDNVTVDSLYELVLARISRYVKLCKEMYESHNSGNQSTDNGLSSAINGINDEAEEEMDLQNVAGDNEENNSEPENSQSDGSAADENDKMENGPTKRTTKGNKQNCKKKLFSFSVVNAYGTSDFSSITEDGAFLKLNSHSTVAIDWDPEIKKMYYDDQEAEAYEKHESMSQPQKKRSSVALRECIDLFTTMETLGEHDLWYCPTCKKHQQATKKFDLWSLPKILVVHLKRFSYNRYWRDKLDTLVEFPIRDLNMSEFVYNPKAGPCIYDLVAVTNHYGGMGGGHYTAYAKNKIDGQWYYFDDSSVSGASEDQIVTKAAYVLFYQRRDPNSHYNSSSASSSPSAEENGESRKNEEDKMDTN